LVVHENWFATNKTFFIVIADRKTLEVKVMHLTLVSALMVCVLAYVIVERELNYRSDQTIDYIFYSLYLTASTKKTTPSSHCLPTRLLACKPVPVIDFADETLVTVVKEFRSEMFSQHPGYFKAVFLKKTQIIIVSIYEYTVYIMF
jgi:hypothetical protein